MRFSVPPLFYAVCCLFISGTPLLHSAIAHDTSVNSTQRPNVVLFFIDDLGITDLGCYGAAFHETPHLDRLAKQSVQFTNFYSAHPVCSPTRAALMTGRAPQRLGITNWIPQPSEIHLPHEPVSMAEAFSVAGYRTGYIGKWHLGEKDDQLPTAHGFQWQRCVNRAGQPGSYFFPYQGRTRQGIRYHDVPDLEDRHGRYLTDGLTDHALEFISENQNQPFFLCLAHYAVHTPIQSPDSLVKKYQQKRRDSFGESETTFELEKFNSRSRGRQDHPGYAAMVENLDDNVGRVLDHLRELSLDRSTIVIFTSDNGGLSTLKGNRKGPATVLPYRAGKGWVYEGGIRVPTLISWPETVEPGLCKQPAITMDLFPTLLDLCDLKQQPAQHLDGRSLVRSMRGESDPSLAERSFLWHFPHGHGSGHRPASALRVGNHKLIQFEHGERELYDLSCDPYEKNNLIRLHHELAEEMQRQLQRQLQVQTQPRQ